MSDKHYDEEVMEVDGYELFAGHAYQFGFDRRQFIKVFGGGIALIVPLTNLLAQQPQQRLGESGRGGSNHRIPNDIGAWIHIDQDGGITVYTGKVEMGQNIRTSLSQAVAEELSVPLAMVNLVMGDTDLTPFDMGTFGSRTTPTMAPQLRKAAAAARTVLIELAAQHWNVEPSSVRIVNARFVNHDTTKSLTFADLAKGQKLVKAIPAEVVTTPPKEWTIAGTPVPKVGGRDFVTGKHQYTSDLKREGMLFGKVVRPAGFNATLLSTDTKAAEAMPGVTVVHDGDFIGVAAPDQQTASRAANVIAVHWKAPGQPANAELFDYLRKHPAEGGRGGGGHAVGSIADGLAAADKKLEQTYTVEYIAHAPLEPRAAVAQWKDDNLTVWTRPHRPFAVRAQLAEAFHIPEEKVRVIVPDTGSGYGGKNTAECAL